MRMFLVLICSLLTLAYGEESHAFEKELRQEVSQLVELMDKETQAAFLQDIDEKKQGGRWQMRYTGGERLGVKLGDLTKKPYAQVRKILKLLLSDYGVEMMEKVMAQDGEKAWRHYYLSCFGDPRSEEEFAFRFGEHHLNVVYLEVKGGELREFGPVLWGSNPATLWQEEEKDLISLWNTLTEEERKKILVKEKAGIASKAMRKGEGVPLNSLSPAAELKVRDMMERRYRVFSPVLQKRFKALSMEVSGDETRIAFYKEPAEKPCMEGGRWDFKIGTERVNTDFETSRGHIHMSMWVKAE